MDKNRDPFRSPGRVTVHGGIRRRAAAFLISTPPWPITAMIDAQVGSVLSGLGFSKHDWSRQTEGFSGGWQMRIALAKLLLQKPSLLLLDEPTNHLDLESRNWLEDYLHGYPNGYILISHDRYFLDVRWIKR